MKTGLLFLLLFSTLANAADPGPPVLPRRDGVFRVVAFGDSLTGDRPGKPYLHQYLKWTDLLQMGLELRLGEGRAEVLNMGYAGDATFPKGDRPGALQRLESNILAQKPDLAVILIGGNDFSDKRADPETVRIRFRENLTATVRRCKEAGIRVLLLQYPEPRAADMTKVWTHLDDGNDIIAAVAAAEDVATLALAPAFARAAEQRPLAELLNPVDGVHLNPAGEILVAREVLSALAALDGKP